MSTPEEAYRVRVVVLDPDDRRVDKARVWSTLFGDAQLRDGVWEFEIAPDERPQDDRLVVYAETSSMKGHEEVVLDGRNAAVEISVRRSDSVVKGRVVDDVARPIGGARVSRDGYDDHVLTNESGWYELSVSASGGQVVRVRVEKEGFLAKEQHQKAGGESTGIVLIRE